MPSGLSYRADDFARDLFAAGFGDSYAKRVASNHGDDYDVVYEAAYVVGYSLGSARFLVDILNRRGIAVPDDVEKRFASYRTDAAFGELLNLVVESDTLDDVVAALDVDGAGRRHA